MFTTFFNYQLYTVGFFVTSIFSLKQQLVVEVISKKYNMRQEEGPLILISSSEYESENKAYIDIRSLV